MGFGAFQSSYGKSAYMLVYERKEKKPVKILVDEENKQAEGVFKDEDKNEYYKMVQFK